MTVFFDQFDVADGIDNPVNASWWNTVWLNIDSRIDDLEDNAVTIGGIKTFSAIPVLPASDPTADNQAARKKYVDDNFTASGHTHVEANITDLVHNASLLQSRLLSAAAPSDGQMLVWSAGGSTWQPGSVGASSTNFGGLNDVTLTSLAQGDITFYNGAAWVNLGPGTSGQVLKTGGAAANPSWGTVTGQVTFDAVVATSGGDYTLLSAAISAGETSIFIRNGTYSETTDIRIASDTVIFGESRDGVIIDFGSSDKSILVANASAGVYLAVVGVTALAFTVDDKTVTGTATAFVANVSAGDVVFTKSSPWGMEVASITNNTAMELVDQYEGASTGAQHFCVSQSPTRDVQITNITIKKDTTFSNWGIDCDGAYRCLFQNIKFEGTRGLRFSEGCSSNQVIDCESYNPNNTGFIVGSGAVGGHRNGANIFKGCNVYNTTVIGFTVAGGTLGTQLINCSVFGAGTTGISLVENATTDPNRPYATLIQNCTVVNTVDDGVEIGNNANGANFTVLHGVSCWDCTVAVDDNGASTSNNDSSTIT